MVAGRLILEASGSHVEALLERLRPERMLLLLVDPMASSYWAPGPKDAHVLPHYDVRCIERSALLLRSRKGHMSYMA